jgi:7-cyano-7-deazaguanine synthase in queuosine biosynthesis
MLNYASLVAGLPRQLLDRELDWLDTIGNLFAVDLACGRGNGDLEWTRSIEAHFPVREPAYWQQLAPAIQTIFGDFTSDRLLLHFAQADDADPPPRQRHNPFPSHDCVALLSGGVDSFVGAAALIRDGHSPLAVSHTAAGSIAHAQSQVGDVLRRQQPDLERLGLTAKKYGATFPQPEPSQRSRSFLFLAAASMVASVGGSNSVFINENGVMAIHLPMTAARLGSLSTHTASPVILDTVERLAQEVLQAPISITNELLALTKPEVVRFGVELGLVGDLAETVSCWSIGRTNQHCGVCAPCLMRRISFDLHGVPDATYKDDAFNDEGVLENEFATDNLTHLVRLTGDLDTKSDLELQLDYPELINGGHKLPLGQTIELHRRWATEARGVLFAYAVPSLVR